MGDETSVDEAALKYLLSRPSLKRMSLRFRSQQIVQSLSKCLKTSQYLEHLDLRSNFIGDQGVHVLVGGLFHSNITSLNLGFNLIGDAGAAALAQLLADSRCNLVQLDLNCNLIGNGGAQAISDALRGNRTLKSLVLLGNSRLSCGDPFVECLYTNITLEKCDLQRTEIENVRVIDYYLTLNRCGRSILRLGDIPCGLWPILLDRVSQKSGDAMYFFCTQKPELFHDVQ